MAAWSGAGERSGHSSLTSSLFILHNIKRSSRCHTCPGDHIPNFRSGKERGTYLEHSSSNLVCCNLIRNCFWRRPWHCPPKGMQLLLGRGINLPTQVAMFSNHGDKWFVWNAPGVGGCVEEGWWWSEKWKSARQVCGVLLAPCWLLCILPCPSPQDATKLMPITYWVRTHHIPTSVNSLTAMGAYMRPTFW